jgi:hypothetical protein
MLVVGWLGGWVVLDAVEFGVGSRLGFKFFFPESTKQRYEVGTVSGVSLARFPVSSPGSTDHLPTSSLNLI